MILVAGGTGRLGTLVVSHLAAGGRDVRVLTRDPTRAHHLPDGVAEIVNGDVRDRASIERALRGVTTVVSAVHGFAGPGRVSPASVDRDGNANLVDVATAAGADVVLMSVVGASVDSPMELFRAKHAAEQHLRESGTPWTIVRATAFVELWAEIMAKPIVFGRGNNPINFVSVGDVAAVVERAVVDAGLRGGPGSRRPAEPDVQRARRAPARRSRPLAEDSSCAPRAPARDGTSRAPGPSRRHHGHDRHDVRRIDRPRRLRRPSDDRPPHRALQPGRRTSPPRLNRRT
jgi:uncharacterized protein YbjT (DUF2867 family)